VLHGRDHTLGSGDQVHRSQISGNLPIGANVLVTMLRQRLGGRPSTEERPGSLTHGQERQHNRERAGRFTADPALPAARPSTFVPQLFWLALTSGLLYVLLKRFALPRVGQVIEERRKHITRDLDQAEKLKTETQLALSNYQQALTEAHTMANTIAREMRDQLAAAIQSERARMETQLSQKLAEAESGIAQRKARTMANVDLAAETASAIVTRLIGHEVSNDGVQRAPIHRAAE
jgi:F-type H+-transporting ATPase subunit b